MSEPRWQSFELRTFRATVDGMAGAARGQAQRTSLVLRIADDHGGWGQGEASPLPAYSSDTIELCEQELGRLDWACLPRPAPGEAADAWCERALAASDLQAPAARFALETALLDWLGRQRGVALWRLLGGSDPQRSVPLSALVADIATARHAHAAGVRCFKLKLDPAQIDSTLALAAALRAEFGAHVGLRFDANGRIAGPRLGATLAALACFTPEFVEEPISGAALAALRDSPVALAADESLAHAGGWPALAASCQVLVLKPTLLGGLLRCRQLGHEAAERGLAVSLTHTFDGPIAQAATAQLALALPGRVLACGLGRHAAAGVWPAEIWPPWQANAITAREAPGLGLPDLLRRPA
ncbi:MAG: enolase C-terminal domain-like protein [Burkholderiaceae bacterium]